MSDTSVGFVRTEPIPPSAPPPAEAGVIKWVRENLFRSFMAGVVWARYPVFALMLVVLASQLAIFISDIRDLWLCIYRPVTEGWQVEAPNQNRILVKNVE